jgi:arsenate reductase
VPINVLFICTANSARSIMAEAMLNELGGGRFRAFSAGSRPSGKVDPITLDVLAKNGYGTQGLRSKSWQEFARDGAERLDFVISVCDDAASEDWPAFRGRPVSAHWHVSDPAAAPGSAAQRRAVFLDALGTLRRRIQAFTSLPFESVDKAALRSQLRDIGES